MGRSSYMQVALKCNEREKILFLWKGVSTTYGRNTDRYLIMRYDGMLLRR